MVKNIWWQRPQLRKDEEQQLERKVGWLELFFDLVFVAVMRELAHYLSAHISAAGVGSFILLSIPVWWIWVGATYYNERFQTEGLESRVFTFIKMLPVAGLAVFIHHGLGETSAGFALSYAAAHLIVTYLWWRGGYHDRNFRPTAKRLVIGYSISIILFIISAFIPSPGRFVLWGIGLTVDLLTPLFTIRQQAALPKFSTSRLPERFGLFVMIVLGESVIGVVEGISKNENLSLLTALTGIFGMTLVFSFWWVYFDFIARRPFKQSMGYSFAWAYLHMPLVIAITATGAGIVHVISANENVALSDNVRILISCSVAVFLGVIGLIEVTLRRKDNDLTDPIFSPCLKWGAALLAILLGLFGKGLGSVIFLTLLILLVAIQIGYGLYVWIKSLEAMEN
ncbi:MAG: low temperature requirement protein A [Microcoleaceae cyanobacterium MO_207.B10]|nr:low temperature requirement protein A [Microcoleaceae cyanobacterium MO_207.B10]